MKITLVFLILWTSCYAEVLTLEKVLISTEKYHPILEQQIAEIEAAKSLTTESLGAFDATLSGMNKQRQTGYYNGDVTEINVEKGLQYFNSKVFLKHRVSDGEFPVYESEYETLSRGENSLGISFSLLKDRAIDEKRYKLWNSKLKINEFNKNYIEFKNILVNQATQAYWNWVVQGKKLVVYENLVKVADKRQVALEKRVARGDLARIYLAENKQYLLKRKSNLQKAILDFQNASLYLSFFFRDNAGNPLIALVNNLPDKIENDFNKKPNYLADKVLLKDLSPTLQRIETQVKQVENQLMLGENELKPTLDLKLERVEDRGLGPDRLGETDNKLSLNFAIPLERNLGQGKVSIAKAKRKILERKKQYIYEQLTVKLGETYNTILAYKKVLENTQEEVELAKQLEVSELDKFYNGGSDFFVVNLREQNTADSEINLLDAKLQVLIKSSEYNMLATGVLNSKS